MYFNFILCRKTVGILFAGGYNYLLFSDAVKDEFPSSLVKLGKHVIKKKYGIFAANIAVYLTLTKLQGKNYRTLLTLRCKKPFIFITRSSL